MTDVPYFLRSVEHVPFQDIVLKQHEPTLRDDMRKGDVVILEDVFNPEILFDLVDRVHEYGQKEKNTTDIKMVDDCPNYNQIVQTDLDPSIGYSTINRSFYFFRWNEDKLGIFNLVDEAWDTIKEFWHIPADSYKNNIPSDGMVERVQILFYPLNHGFLSTHSDGQTAQELVIGIPLTDIGTHYAKGGLYFIDEKKKHNYVDHISPCGEVVTWVGSILHGVDEPTSLPYMPPHVHWFNQQGRWMMLLSIVESHVSKNRQTSKSMKQILDTL